MVDNDLGSVLKSFSAREIAAMLPKLLYEDEYYSVALIDTGSGVICLLYTSPIPRDYAASRMPSSA